MGEDKLSSMELRETPSFQEGGEIMLSYALLFLVIAVIAGVLGFIGLAGVAAGIAKILFFVFLILFVLSFFNRRVPSA